MQDIDVADLKGIAELIFTRYHYDFRNYAMSSFKRRVLRILDLKKLTVNTLFHKLTDDPLFMDEFLDEITVNVTEMFRDPPFWRAMRDEVIPALKLANRPLKIWHAGCSSGEEILTMCIMLKELDLLDEVSLTASDVDTGILQRAKAAAYPLKNMEVNEKNFLQFQPLSPTLKNYYQVKNGVAHFNSDLFSRVTFMKHDLVLGEVFDRFDLILCRNVMIYFNQNLQNDVLKKFHESLIRNGFLSIGSKESLIWCDYANRFTVLNREEKIYKKK